jgi:putative membrane protein insertion efficiency factor
MISRFLTQIGLAALHIYRTAVSPHLPPVCRFTPSCSQYAEDAIRLHGPYRGAAKAIIRLLRCHPFSRGGYDPAS